MSKIKVLEEQLINMISAGEVIERPASVVKELVENSIDAGSKRIIIIFEEGGQKLIQITDNGCGMSREDALLSLKRHATSKLKTVDDLENITTLGFRGEALASIAVVSKLQVITREEKNPLGFQVTVEGGEITQQGEVGSPAGTIIKVESLFYNTPARKKFLKKPATERAYIISTVEQIGLAYPSINFQLISSNYKILQLPGTGDYFASLSEIFGPQQADQLLYFEENSGDYQLKGFLSRPDVTKNSRQGQYFYLNNRFIKSRLISYSLQNAFSGLVADKSYPLAVLFFTVNPQLVDVNVHPTKMEVRFQQEQLIASLVYKGVQKALASKVNLPQALPKKETAETPFLIQPFALPEAKAPETAETKPAVFFARKQPALKPSSPSLDFFKEVISPTGDYQKSLLPEDVSFTIYGQIFNNYIIIFYKDELILIDQHAAAERINYDRLVAKKNNFSQLLLTPILLKLSAKEIAFLEEHRDFLTDKGFQFDSFGVNTYLVREIPFGFEKLSSQQVLQELLAELIEEEKIGTDLEKKLLSTIACKAAVKAGDHLNIKEMEQLVKDLLATENPFTCPHGRPIAVKFSHKEIDKFFKRT